MVKEMQDNFCEQKLLTVSVASYNVEKTLRKTLDSFCDKRYIDYIEVLIEDDGSTDKTQDIGKEYEMKYPQSFRYIKKDNGGHGSTINKSIELAQGLYFKVIDGDDWVDNNDFNELINVLKKYKELYDDNKSIPELILSNYAEAVNNTESVKKIKLFDCIDPCRVYDINEIDILNSMTIHTITVKTSILKENNVRITEKCYYVDVEYIMWCIYLSNSIVFYDITPYMYRVANENQSISKNSLIKNIKMQERVSVSTSILYDSWFGYNKHIEGKNVKQKSCIKIVRHVIGATIRTYMLMTDTKNSMYMTRELENRIKSINAVLYNELNGDLFFKTINVGRNCMFPIVRFIYRRKWKY